MKSARLILHQISQRYFYLVARLIASGLPERLWYRALFRICCFQQHMLRPLLMFTPYRNDPKRRIILTWLMDSSLLHLISLGRPFPIPMRHKDIELILDARTNPVGLVLCSVHLPFVRLSLRTLLEAGVQPTAVVAHPTALTNGKLPVGSTAEYLPGLVADRNVLFKVRTILRQGGCVATLIDLNLAGPLNSNVFRLIRSTGARVVFFVSELQSDGAILIEFLKPPDPFCKSNESVVSNLLFLQDRIGQILQLPALRDEVTILPTRKAPIQAKSVSLELDSSS
jgi:hypothetical protein